jgi:hypothetical protein
MSNTTKSQPVAILNHNYTSLFMVVILVAFGLMAYNFDREILSVACIATALIIPFMTFSYVKMYDDYFTVHYYLIPLFRQKIYYSNIARYELDNVGIILTTKTGNKRIVTRLKDEHILLQKILEYITYKPATILKS